MRSKSGMTLIELVIVLALMAGLAGVALTTVGSMGHRARYDETTARMQLIRRTIITDSGEAGRFMRDMGRLPIRFSANTPENEGRELEELWRDAGSVGYGDITLDPIPWPDSPAPPTGAPTTVTLRAGWNGPYLTAINDPESATFFDGFGYAWQALSDGDSDAAVNETIEKIRTLGADGAAGGSGWENEDRDINLAALLPATSLTVHAKARDSGEVWRTVVVGAGDEPYQVDALRIGLFAPNITHNSSGVSSAIRENESTAVFTDLPPTTVRVFAYSTGPDQVSGVEPEWVTLRPGSNSITLYLLEVQ